MMKNPIHIISTSALALIMTACGQGYKSTGNGDSGVGTIACGALSSAACGPSTDGGVAVQQQLNQVDMKGKVLSGIFSNMTFINIDSVEQTLVLQIPIGSNPLGSNLAYPIPELPGATAGIQSDSSGNWFIGVKIPLRDLVHGVQLTSVQSLPDGKPFPGLPNGTLQSVTLPLAGLVPIHLYLGIDTAAVFIELPMTDKYMNYLNYLPFQLTLPIKNSAQTVIGNFAPIAPVQAGATQFSGGLYVSTTLPPAVADILNSIF